MKKRLFAGLMTAMMMASVIAPASVFAAEEKPDLPYVDGLGYEVNVDEDVTFYNYDSDWKDFLGGSWRHGVSDTQVWSWYDHNSKVHKTTVQGAGGKYGYSGWTDPGVRAKASWEKAWFGNHAWADVQD